MGWLNNLGRAAGDVVDKFAGGIAIVVITVGDFAADWVETAGNAAAGGLDAGGEQAAKIPGMGRALRAVSRWLAGVLAGVTNLIGAAVKAGLGIIAGVVSGLIRMIGGFFVLNFALVQKGEIDIGSSIAGAVVLLSGVLVSLGQRMFGLQNKERRLTKAERAMLSKVFRNSLSLYNIRLIEGWSGLFGVNDRAFTLGNTIYMKGTDAGVEPQTLVHECVHVWQNQNIGSRYTMDALGAQAIYGNDAYKWEDELARGNSDWNDFNKEAQAQFIQNVWSFGAATLDGVTDTGNGCFFTALGCEQNGSEGPTVKFEFHGIDRTNLAIAAAESLRGRANLRWSRNF